MEKETIVKYNLAQKKMKENKIFVSDYVRRCGYKCIVCGDEVSPAVVKFFEDDVTMIKCYKCQNVT